MIILENVSKTYPGSARAVKELSLEVKEGEICVLLGPSGCGKTTVMRMINRLIPVTEGRITIKGKDNREMDENELRKDVGYAIQNVGLFPHMTVGENIETVPLLKGWSKEKRKHRVKALLELFRLDPDEFINKYPQELSGGQRQRVGVARAIGGDPPILLMDEPFGAIDPITRVQLQDEFLRIQDEIRKTIIFVTHDIHEAIRIGDKIALMKEGRLVQFGPPTELLFRPHDAFVAGFVGADRALKGLQLIRAKEVMWEDPPAVSQDDSVETARERMEAESVQWVVVKDGEKLAGYVPASELNRKNRIREIMIPAEATITRNSVLNEALSLLLTSGLDFIGVVDRQNRLEGVLTLRMIQSTLLKTVQDQKPE